MRDSHLGGHWVRPYYSSVDAFVNATFVEEFEAWRWDTFDSAFGQRGEHLRHALHEKRWEDIEIMICRALRQSYSQELVISDRIIAPLAGDEIGEIGDLISLVWDDLPKYGSPIALRVSDPSQWHDYDYTEDLVRDLVYVSRRLAAMGASM